MTSDSGEIKRALSVLFRPGDVVELRALDVNGKTHSGYLNDFEKLAQAAAGLSGRAAGVYVVLNRINSDLLARAANHTAILKNTTQDADIIRRLWLPIDIDAKRPSGISSTDQEHEAALDTAKKIKVYLIDHGFPRDSILTGDSGNGGHVLVKIDLSADKEGEAIIKACLKALECEFNSDKVSIDQSVFNAARIWKLPGTMARKGDSTPDRPHRIARLLDIPTRMVTAPIEALKALAAIAPVPEIRKQVARVYQGSGQPFDIEAWLSKYNIEVLRVGPYQGGKRYILKFCPFNPDHTGTSVVVIQHASGALSFKCQHDSCAGKEWADLRELKEPGYRDRGNGHEEIGANIGTNIYTHNTNVTKLPTHERDKNVTQNVTSEAKSNPQNVTSNSVPLAERITDWVKGAIGGWWGIDELDRDLDIRTEADKTNRRQVIHRLTGQVVIEQHEKIHKQYRTINKKITSLDFKTANSAGILPIRWPLSIEKAVNIFPGNIICLAGSPNSGKTALLLNSIYLNQDAFPIYYLCSEMGAVELRDRLEMFPGMDINDWKFKAIERASDFADVIVPDCVNIVDYLEMTTDLWEVNKHLTAISHKLGSGIAFVALQKKIGASIGRGQEFGLEKPKLYLSLDKGKLTIVKGKIWAKKGLDPNGLTIKFEIENGCLFKPITGWTRGDNTTALDAAPTPVICTGSLTNISHSPSEPDHPCQCGNDEWQFNEKMQYICGQGHLAEGQR